MTGQCHDIQHYDKALKNIQHIELNCDTQQKHWVRLSVAFSYCYAECQNAECRDADWSSCKNIIL